jgi:signal peptidase I
VARTRWQAFSRSWIGSILIVVAVMLPLRSAIADWNDVPTGSMEPTILPGDRIFVNKLAYGLRVPFTTVWVAEWSGPRAGDIVTLLEPTRGTRLVKRVVAGPGDRLELRDNVLYINGSALGYRPLSGAELDDIDAARREAHVFALEDLGGHAHVVAATPAVRAMRSFGPVTVPAGKYFVMGDNRDVSGDSRYFGFVARQRITGRSPGVALSLDPDHGYQPRFDRFFKGLR